MQSYQIADTSMSMDHKALHLDEELQIPNGCWEWKTQFSPEALIGYLIING